MPAPRRELTAARSRGYGARVFGVPRVVRGA